MVVGQLAGEEWVTPDDEKAARKATAERARRALLRVVGQHRDVTEDLDAAAIAALRDGCSYATVGRALGMTKQAVAYRYRDRL